MGEILVEKTSYKSREREREKDDRSSGRALMSPFYVLI